MLIGLGKHPAGALLQFGIGPEQPVEQFLPRFVDRGPVLLAPILSFEAQRQGYEVNSGKLFGGEILSTQNPSNPPEDLLSGDLGMKQALLHQMVKPVTPATP